MAQNYDSFISYRRSSSMHLARNIFTELNRRGTNAFLDVEHIDATQFDTFILNQIEARPHFVLLLSPHSLERCVNKDDWLLREIQRAYDLKRNIIPVYDVGFDWDAERHYLPPDLQEFLPLQNAVSFTHEYYGAFIDKILRFIRNPQQKAPIKVKAVPKEEAQQAQKMIQKALEVRFDDFTVIQLIGKYHQLSAIAKTSTDWQDLLQLWSEIRASDNVPDIFDMQEEETEARHALDEALKREEEARQYQLYVQAREQEYDFIRQLHQVGTVPAKRIRQTLEKFWAKYPHHDPFYDPDGIATHVMPPKPNLSNIITVAQNFTGKRNSDWTPVIVKLGEIDPQTPIPELEMCLVPAGKFMMGGDKEAHYYDGSWKTGVPDGGLQTIAKPYWIARYPVTNAQWRRAVEAGAVREPYDTGWYNDKSMQDAPVVYVDWFMSKQFAQWARCALPSEMHWEYATRGVESWVYPWGNDFVSGNLIYEKTPKYGDTMPAPVTMLPQGASWIGAMHMSGNVWEWTTSEYKAYPYDANDGRERDTGSSTDVRRVLRGGSFLNSAGLLRSAYRDRGYPTFGLNNIGLRCLRSY